MKPILFFPPLLLLFILTSCPALDPNSTDFQVENGRLVGKISLFREASDHSELCPQCPRYLTVNSDERPEVTAANFCAKLPSSVKIQDGVDCKAFITQSVINRQLSLFVEMGLLLYEHLRAEGTNTMLVEGNSFTYLDKIRLMQRLVHHKEVETVCEIGFNAGHSALLWLSSGARKVLSFELGQYAYSTKALSFLNKHYPGRIQVMLGNSLETVPSFHAMWPDERCNLLFVDGGHLYEHAMGDLQNLRLMRNESFHLLLVDDTNQGEVATAWREYIAAGYAVEGEEVWSDYSEKLEWFDKGGLEESLVIVDGSSVTEWRSSMAFGYYTDLNNT